MNQYIYIFFWKLKLIKIDKVYFKNWNPILTIIFDKNRQIDISTNLSEI